MTKVVYGDLSQIFPGNSVMCALADGSNFDSDSLELKLKDQVSSYGFRRFENEEENRNFSIPFIG